MGVPKVGNPICSWQTTKQTNVKSLLHMVTVIALMVLGVYIFVKAAKRNKVEETCIKRFDLARCMHALGNTVRETAQSVGPVIASCRNPVSPTCYAAMGRIFVQQLGNLPYS